MALPNRVKIVEVGPRDGLQNEKTIVPLAVKELRLHRAPRRRARPTRALLLTRSRWPRLPRRTPRAAASTTPWSTSHATERTTSVWLWKPRKPRVRAISPYV